MTAFGREQPLMADCSRPVADVRTANARLLIANPVWSDYLELEYRACR